MWIHLSDEECSAIGRSLAGFAFPTHPVEKALLKRFQERRLQEADPERQKMCVAFIEAAKNDYSMLSDGDLDFDDIPMVSESEEGAYVMAWLWVSNATAGICEECGQTGADNGEGWNGLCGDCADKRENEENAE